MILNMTLSFGVYPFLRSRMGAEGSGKMLFFTAIMGLMASAVGSGINYGRMKASTRHETKNGNRKSTCCIFFHTNCHYSDNRT